MSSTLIRYKFDASVPLESQSRIREAMEEAFENSAIVPCACPSLDAFIYETRPPDFQASVSCKCSLMRPVFSSTPDEEDD